MFDYAKKIKEYRERKFLTQDELAKILNVNVICIREYELLELGKKSLPYVFELSRTIILATFLYSKYVVCFTD